MINTPKEYQLFTYLQTNNLTLKLFDLTRSLSFYFELYYSYTKITRQEIKKPRP